MQTIVKYLAALTLCLAGAAGAQELAVPARIAFASLPLERAIKTVHGKGTRQLAVFSDPDCPYCQKLERETLNRIDDVTIYTFLFPLDQHNDAARKSRLIWCAPDRALAWNNWMQGRQLPPPGICVPPLTANLKLGKKLGVSVTPTLVLPQGEFLLGAVDAETLEQKLKEAP